MTKYLVTDDQGRRQVRRHPGWLTGDTPEEARPLTPEELVAAGYGLIIVDSPPAYDRATQTRTEDPIDTWPTDDTTATKTYTVTDLTPQEIRSKLPALSPRQLRLGLLSIGITETQIDALLEGNTEGMIEWKHATHFSRNHPLVVQLAVALELTEAEVDALWAWAATIQ